MSKLEEFNERFDKNRVKAIIESYEKENEELDFEEKRKKLHIEKLEDELEELDYAPGKTLYTEDGLDKKVLYEEYQNKITEAKAELGVVTKEKETKLSENLNNLISKLQEAHANIKKDILEIKEERLAKEKEYETARTSSDSTPEYVTKLFKEMADLDELLEIEQKELDECKIEIEKYLDKKIEKQNLHEKIKMFHDFGEVEDSSSTKLDTTKVKEEVEAESKKKAEAEVEAKKKAEAEVEAKKKAEAEVEAKKKAEAEVEAKKKAEAEAEAKKKAEAEAEAKKKEESKVELKKDPVVDPKKDPEVDPKTEKDEKVDLKDVKIIIGKKGLEIQAPNLNKEDNLDKYNMSLKELKEEVSDWEEFYDVEEFLGKELTDEQLEKVDPNILTALSVLMHSDVDLEIKKEAISRYAESITADGKVPEDKSLKGIIEYDRTGLDYLKPRNMISRIIHKKQLDEMKQYADIAEEMGIADVKQDKPGWVRQFISNVRNKVKLLGTGDLAKSEEYLNAKNQDERDYIIASEKHRRKTKDRVSTHTSITEKNGKIKTTTYELNKDGKLKKENPFKKGLKNVKATIESNRVHETQDNNTKTEQNTQEQEDEQTV